MSDLLIGLAVYLLIAGPFAVFVGKCLAMGSDR